MTGISLQREAPEEEKKVTTVATTSMNTENRKFFNAPITVASSVPSIAQIPTRKQRFYSRFDLLASGFLLPQVDELIFMEEKPKEQIFNDISINRIEASANLKRGKFFTSLSHIPQLQAQLQDSELEEEEEEEEAIWRGIFPLSHSTKSSIIFSEDIEINVDRLPVWRPNVIIDIDRLKDDEE